jgi:hypothetical protein
MSQENVDTVIRAYEAFNEGNPSLFLGTAADIFTVDLAGSPEEAFRAVGLGDLDAMRRDGSRVSRITSDGASDTIPDWQRFPGDGHAPPSCQHPSMPGNGRAF